MKKSITQAACDILNEIYKASPGAAVALTRNRIPLPPGRSYPANLVEQSKGYTPGDPQPMVTPLRLVNAILADAGGGRISLPCGAAERSNTTPGFVISESGGASVKPQWGTNTWWTIGHTGSVNGRDPGSCRIGYHTGPQAYEQTVVPIQFRADVAYHLVSAHNADFGKQAIAEILNTGNAELDGVWFVSQVLRDEGDFLYCVTSKNKQILIGPINDLGFIVHLVNLHNSTLIVGTETQALQNELRERWTRINNLLHDLEVAEQKNKNQADTIQSYMEEKAKTQVALAELEKSINKLVGKA